MNPTNKIKEVPIMGILEGKVAVISGGGQGATR